MSGLGAFQDARCKLVEDTPNVLGSLIEHACPVRCAVGLPVQALHRMLYGGDSSESAAKPTVAELPANEWARATARSGTG